jgi:hypothetical protein
MTISYDPKCEELARFFLNETETGGPIHTVSPENVRSLSGAIQRAIEDWFFEHDGEDPLAEREPEDHSGEE